MPFITYSESFVYLPTSTHAWSVVFIMIMLISLVESLVSNEVFLLIKLLVASILNNLFLLL